MEDLSQYLDRVMRQKNISPKELARICGITDSYIGRVTRGKGINLTIKTILALADGLDVDPHELFTAACGRPPHSQGRSIDPLLVIDTIQKLMMNPKGLELFQDWLRLSANNQKTLADFLKYLNEQKPKSEESKSKSRRK
jgi:transcriptional regulator with XRE-family HTH domain